MDIRKYMRSEILLKSVISASHMLKYLKLFCGDGEQDEVGGRLQTLSVTHLPLIQLLLLLLQLLLLLSPVKTSQQCCLFHLTP